MITPFYADETVQLFHGDCREVLPQLVDVPGSVVTDPPYGETTAVWDRWPDGWVHALEQTVPSAASLWFFGSTRLLLARAPELAGWRYAQERLWVKKNGTGPTSRDRLVRVHEWAYHWYRGPWGGLHHEWEREPAAVDKGTVRKLTRAAEHQNPGRQASWTDDGTRQPKSVTYGVEAPSVRYQRRHQDEKPVAVVAPLVRECTPPGGTVLDPFAGTGTTAVAARLTGRRAVLIEADEAMCEIAAARLAEEVLTFGGTA